MRDELALAGGGRLRALACRALVGELAPGAEGLRDLGCKISGVAVGIQERALRVAAEQQLVLVLPMDVRQAIPQLAKLRGGRGPAVDEAARAPTRIDRPAQQACAIALVEVARREPVAHGGERSQVEVRADLRALRAGAHDTRIGTAAQRERKGIDKDRLSRPRLPRQRREAGRKLEVEPIDDDVIANRKRSKH